MKKIIPFLFCLFCIAAQGQNIIRGGEITYRGLDSSRYEVTAVVYVNCYEVSSSTPFNPSISCTVAGVPLSADSAWFVSSQDVTGINSKCSNGSRCQDSTQPYGIEKRVYRAIFDHDTFSACTMLFKVEHTGRTNDINTGLGGSDFLVYAEVNHCLVKGQGSFSFQNQNPIFLLCHNQDAILSFSVADTSGSDSIAYIGVVPGNCPMSCNWPSLTYFGFPNKNLSWPAGYHVDPITGEVLFRPTGVNQVGPLAVEARIWRKINGVMTLIGVTHREIVYTVIACANNKIPKLLAPYAKQVCAGQKLCFDIVSDDDDLGDTVDITWSNTIPGATFTHNNDTAKRASGQVCWTPNAGDISNIPYTFTITAKDDACPISGTTTRAYAFFVRESPNGTHSVTKKGCGLVELSATPDKSYPGLAIQWKVRDTSGAQVLTINGASDTIKLQPGTYVIQCDIRTSTPCFKTFFDTVVIPVYHTVKLPADSLVCFRDSIDIFANVSGTGPYTFDWAVYDKAGLNTFQGTSPLQRIALKDSLYMKVRATDNGGCYNEDTLVLKSDRFRVKPSLLAEFCSGDTISIGQDTVLQPGSISWNTGDTIGEIWVSTPGMYVLSVAYPQGCRSVDSISVQEHQHPQVNLPQSFTVCENAPFSAYAVLNNSVNVVSWDWFENGQAISNTGQTYNYFPNQSHSLKVVATTDKGCIGVDSLFITVDKIILQFPWLSKDTCAGSSVLIGPSNPSSSYTYMWNSGHNVPNVQANWAGTNILTTTSAIGCIRKDTQTVNWQSLPVINLGTDNLVCPGDSEILAANVSGNRPYIYSWNTGSSDSFVYVVPGTYEVEVIDVNGCRSKASRLYYASASIRASFKDTAVCKGSIVNTVVSADVALIQSFTRSDGVNSLFINVQQDDSIRIEYISTAGCSFHHDYLVESLPVPPSSFAYIISGSTVQFYSLDTLPGMAYRFDFDDMTFINGFAGNKTYLNNGNYGVMLTVTDPNTGCSSVTLDTIGLNVGTGELSKANFEIYPNPFVNQVNIRGLEETAGADILLTDLSGRVLYKHSGTGKELSVLNLGDALKVAGSYILIIQQDGVRFSFPLVKMR